MTLISIIGIILVTIPFAVGIISCIIFSIKNKEYGVLYVVLSVLMVSAGAICLCVGGK